MNSKSILAALPLIVLATFAVPSAAGAQGASAELIKSMPARQIVLDLRQNIEQPSRARD